MSWDVQKKKHTKCDNAASHCNYLQGEKKIEKLVFDGLQYF